jgi:glutamine synthetase type III
MLATLAQPTASRPFSPTSGANEQPPAPTRLYVGDEETKQVQSLENGEIDWHKSC